MEKRNGKIFIISGPSGSGKTTVYRKVLEQKKIKNALSEIVSATTRTKREGEINTRDYFFISEKMFLFKQKRGHFLETEKVFNNYYGTPKKSVNDLLKQNKNILLCIDVNGAKTVVKNYPQAVTIFIKTPNMEVLKKRLESRGTDSEESLRIRLKRADKEEKESKKYKHIIINDDLNQACQALTKIILDELERK